MNLYDRTVVDLFIHIYAKAGYLKLTKRKIGSNKTIPGKTTKNKIGGSVDNVNVRSKLRHSKKSLVFREDFWLKITIWWADLCPGPEISSLTACLQDINRQIIGEIAFYSRFQLTSRFPLVIGCSHFCFIPFWIEGKITSNQNPD